MKVFRRLALLTICVVFGVSGASARSADEARYAEMLRTNAAFAAAEKEFSEAKEAFLSALPETVRPRGERLLRRSWDWDLRGSWEYGVSFDEEDAEDLRREREGILRYMDRVSETPYDDPMFGALLLPLFLTMHSYDHTVDVLERAEEGFLALNRDPEAAVDGVLMRRVDGEAWYYLSAEPADLSYSCSDSIAGYVVRPEDGSWRAHGIIAPQAAAFFPTKGEVPELSDRNTEYGYLYPPDLSVTLRVTNGEGPFSFAMDLETDWARSVSDGSMAYILVPECSSVPYDWSAVGETYIRGDADCSSQAKWGAFPPFEDGELMPVAAYRRELMREDREFKAEEDALDYTWQGFSALFAGDGADFVKRVYENWLLDRDYSLVRHIGKPEAFAEASRTLTAPVSRLMLEVFSRFSGQGAKPDADLLFLLDPLHRRFLEEQTEDEYDRSRRVNHDRYLRYDDEPWLTLAAEGQLRVLAGEEPAEDDDGYYYDRMKREMWQFSAKYELARDGADSMTVRHGEAYRYSYDDEMPDTFAAAVSHGQGGEHWGVTEEPVEAYHSYGMGRAQRITRIAGGKIFFVTPELPETGAFFSGGRENWPYEDEAGYYATDCDMFVGFDADMETPFRLTARFMETDSAYNDEEWLCIPECSIPYSWNGSAFVAGEPECLPGKEWGIVRAEQ